MVHLCFVLCLPTKMALITSGSDLRELDVEAFARAMQGSKGDSKEKKEDDEDMSLD